MAEAARRSCPPGPQRREQTVDRMLLRGARVVDPVNGIDAVQDLGIADGLVVPATEVQDAPSFDLSGKVVAPGFIDLHVHLREPGQTHKETIATGTAAAAAGGFTTVVAMPNTQPPIDCLEALAHVQRRISATAAVRVLQTATLTRRRAGAEPTAAAALRRAGAVALTDDGSCVEDPSVLLKALCRARVAGIPVIEHCEDSRLAGCGVMHEGSVSRELGLPGQPASVEELAVARDVVLAREAGWGVHVQHISTAAALAQVRSAQARGVPVSAEVTPHHICLTDEACRVHGANAKMNPPLRTQEDREAIIQGLRDGSICAIATDHAPHTREEKAVGLAAAPFGIVGLETAAAICLTALYQTGVLTLSGLIAKFTAGPRRVLDLPYGSLSLGSPADVTVLDLDAEWVIDPAQFASRSVNCPYQGWECRGKVVGVILAGKWLGSELSDAG